MTKCFRDRKSTSSRIQYGFWMDVPKYSWTPDTFCCFCPPLLYDGKETERARRGALLYRKWRRTEMRVTSVGNCAACDEISFEFCTFTNLDCSSSSSNLSFQSKFIILVGKFSLFFRLPAVCIFISWRNSRQKIRVNRSSSPLWHIQWTIADVTTVVLSLLLQLCLLFQQILKPCLFWGCYYYG